MITLPPLYPHQESIRDRTRASLAALQRVILCAPPGVGKTRIAKWILGASANREPLANQSGKSLFCVHRRGLVFNASNSFAEEPEVPHGIIMSGEETAYGRRIQVASIDTLLSWFIENDKYETNVTFDLIVFDECVSGDAIVETDIGPMRLDDIPARQPSRVKTFSEDRGVHFASILDWTHKGVRDTIVIHTHHGKVRVTPDHEVYTRRGWLHAKDLYVTDEILACVDVDKSCSTPTYSHVMDIPGGFLHTSQNVCGTSWSRVTQIDHGNAADVYDIAVEGTHCFFANGLLVHNCHSHHSKFATFLKYHDAYRAELGLHPAYVVGLTATPQAKGLADVYKEIILGPSTEWLIENKFLSPFRYFRATQGKLGLLIKRGDEYTNDSQAAAFEGLAGDMVRDWKRFAEGRPTVGFFPRRSHAQDAMEQFQNEGLRVEYVDGETPDDKRQKMFRQLNNHEIDYICNVQVIERGTDIPRIGCVQLCVAIGSLPRYRQMIGRGSRVHPEKSDCLILDHGGNVLRHGFFEDDPQWSLDITTKEPGEVGARPTIECPQCCVARGTMILTNRGEIPIQDVRITDLVWDGVEFCFHGGTYCNDMREVIEWGGLILTPDHKVLTNDGWKESQEAKDHGLWPVIGGVGGVPVRTTDDSNPYYSLPGQEFGSRGGLFALWKEGLAAILQDITPPRTWMRTLYDKIQHRLPGMVSAKGQPATTALPVPAESCLQHLWWTWDRVSVFFGASWCTVDCSESWPTTKQVVDDRPHRQQRPLRAGQFTVGDDAYAKPKQRFGMESEISRDISIRDIFRKANIEPSKSGIDPETNCSTLDCKIRRPARNVCMAKEAKGGLSVCEIQQTPIDLHDAKGNDSEANSRTMVAEVWDILNVGPRNRYCANGVIIANCAIYRGGECRQCGYKPTPQERIGQGLEFDGRDLKEVKRKEKPAKPVYSAEELMVSALFRAGKSYCNWKQAVKIFQNECRRVGVTYRVPRHVTISGQRYAMIAYGSNDAGRRVGHLFPITVGKGHGGKYLVQENHSADTPY